MKPLPQVLQTLQSSIQDELIIMPPRREYCEEYIIPVLEGAYWYAFLVSYYLGAETVYYQLGNELNHPRNQMPDEYNAAYIEMLARGVEMGESYRDNKYSTIVNVIADYLLWSYWLESWLNSSGRFIDIIAIDHYPGTWWFDLNPLNDPDWDEWGPLDELIQIAQQYGKIPAIMETGYPSSPPPFHTEEKQASYVDVAFNAIMQRARSNYIAFLSWYMLWDEPGSQEFIYSGWGVLRGDFSRKPAWYRLNDWFENKLG